MIIKILAVIGGLALILLFCAIVISAFYGIKEVIENLKYDYQRKHRFDKPPTAACYCKDCAKWIEKTGECLDDCNSRHMADCWFCCFAEPRKRSEK